MAVRKVGVEEEFLLVDPATGHLTALAASAVRAHEEGSSAPVEEAEDATREDASVEAELFLQQIETQTPPRTSMDDLAEAVRRSRRALCGAAEAAGAAAVALGTPVLLGADVDITRRPRYLRIQETYVELARSALACAMHVHVDVADDEEAVRALDGIAPWLPVVLALSANSPYVDGRDTGHASWRAQLWSRWPSHGTAEPFGDAATYHDVVDHLVEWGAALDPAMAYFDARIAQSYPTVEIRVADVCTDVEDAVLIAALSRALVTTAAASEPEPWRSELLRAASWRASRYGLSGSLVDAGTRALVPARDAIASLVTHVRPALEEAGDLERVEHEVERVLADGNGATRQRRRLESAGTLEAVVLDAVDRTTASWSR